MAQSGTSSNRLTFKQQMHTWCFKKILCQLC